MSIANANSPHWMTDTASDTSMAFFLSDDAAVRAQQGSPDGAPAWLDAHRRGEQTLSRITGKNYWQELLARITGKNHWQELLGQWVAKSRSLARLKVTPFGEVIGFAA